MEVWGYSESLMEERGGEGRLSKNNKSRSKSDNMLMHRLQRGYPVKAHCPRLTVSAQQGGGPPVLCMTMGRGEGVMAVLLLLWRGVAALPTLGGS